MMFSSSFHLGSFFHREVSVTLCLCGKGRVGSDLEWLALAAGNGMDPPPPNKLGISI